MTVSSLEPQKGNVATVQSDWERTIEVAHGRIRLVTIAETIGVGGQAVFTRNVM